MYIWYVVNRIFWLIDSQPHPGFPGVRIMDNVHAFFKVLATPLEDLPPFFKVLALPVSWWSWGLENLPRYSLTHSALRGSLASPPTRRSYWDSTVSNSRDQLAPLCNVGYTIGVPRCLFRRYLRPLQDTRGQHDEPGRIRSTHPVQQVAWPRWAILFFVLHKFCTQRALTVYSQIKDLDKQDEILLGLDF